MLEKLLVNREVADRKMDGVHQFVYHSTRFPAGRDQTLHSFVHYRAPGVGLENERSIPNTHFSGLPACRQTRLPLRAFVHPPFCPMRCEILAICAENIFHKYLKSVLRGIGDKHGAQYGRPCMGAREQAPTGTAYRGLPTEKGGRHRQHFSPPRVLHHADERA